MIVYLLSMKQLSTFLLIICSLALFGQHKSLTFKTDTIALAEVAAHMNSYKVVCGSIERITTTDADIEKVHLIRVGDGEDRVTLVVWYTDALDWDPPFEEWLAVGDKICVQGQISAYGGQPRIEVGNQGQVHK